MNHKEARDLVIEARKTMQAFNRAIEDAKTLGEQTPAWRARMLTAKKHKEHLESLIKGDCLIRAITVMTQVPGDGD